MGFGSLCCIYFLLLRSEISVEFTFFFLSDSSKQLSDAVAEKKFALFLFWILSLFSIKTKFNSYGEWAKKNKTVSLILDYMQRYFDWKIN